MLGSLMEMDACGDPRNAEVLQEMGEPEGVHDIQVESLAHAACLEIPAASEEGVDEVVLD